MQSDDGNSTDKFAELRLQAQAYFEKEEEGMGPLSPDEAREIIHELRTHQIELELQNEELRQTQVPLQNMQQQYSDLYDFAPIGYLTISNKEMIIEANLTASLMLGVGRGNLIKQLSPPLSCLKIRIPIILSEKNCYAHKSPLMNVN